MLETFVETRKGNKVDVVNPQPEQFDIEDIAYALSNTCRYNGHSSSFFSVAEHSILVARRLPRRLQLAGLLHDASEAYLGDIPSPIKQFLPDYKKMEKAFEAVIEKKFDLELSEADRQQIKQADLQSLFTEAHFLIPSQGKDWSYFQGPVKYAVEMGLGPACLPPAHAYEVFMYAYQDLTKSLIQLV